MNSLLQLLVTLAIAVLGAVIALRIDRMEHRRDDRQQELYFPNHDHDMEQRGVAKSRV